MSMSELLLFVLIASATVQAPADEIQPSPDGNQTAGQSSDKPTPADDAETTKAAADNAANAENDDEDGSEQQDATSDTSDEVSGFSQFMNSGAIGLIRQGGPFMWPILLMGVVAAGVIIERYRSLKMLDSGGDDVRTEVQSLLQQDRVEDALTLCDSQQGPVPAILSAGLRKLYILRKLNYDAGRIESQVVKSMDDYSVHIVASLERHLPILATVSSAAPMLGFLGTVSGMINSFDDIVNLMGEMNIVEAAAAGISEALLTTCFGLIIGIPAFVAYNYFTSVINRFVLDVEESATELIEAVTLQIAME